MKRERGFNFDWNDEAVNLVMRLRAEGKSGPKIAAQLGVSYYAYLGKMRRLGLATVSASRWNPETEALLLRLKAEGLHAKEIAAHLGVKVEVYYAKSYALNQRAAGRRPNHKKNHQPDLGPEEAHNPMQLALGEFAPKNMTGRLMGDPRPGRTPWAQP